MIRHGDAARIQEYLDGELPPDASASFRAHLEECAECAAELALYRRTFAALDRLTLVAPPAALAERVLDRVLPSRVRRRWIRTVGLGYAGVFAATLAAVLFWSTRADARALLAGFTEEISQRLVQAVVFTLNLLAFAVVSLVDGFGLVAGAAERLAPLARALGSLLSNPGIQTALATAAVVCVALLWWIRPREKRRPGGVRHVGLLGI